MSARFGPKFNGLIPEPLGTITEPLGVLVPKPSDLVPEPLPVKVSESVTHKQTHKHKPPKTIPHRLRWDEVTSETICLRCSSMKDQTECLCRLSSLPGT